MREWSDSGRGVVGRGLQVGKEGAWQLPWRPASLLLGRSQCFSSRSLRGCSIWQHDGVAMARTPSHRPYQQALVDAVEADRQVSNLICVGCLLPGLVRGVAAGGVGVACMAGQGGGDKSLASCRCRQEGKVKRACAFGSLLPAAAFGERTAAVRGLQPAKPAQVAPP